MDSSSEPLFPVRTVVSRTGVPAHLLRAWERRYGAIRPHRTEGGQRRYSEEEVERIRLLRDAVGRGESIGAVARLPDRALREMITPRERRSAREPAVDDPGLVARRRSALAAVEDRDDARLRAILRREALLGPGLPFLERFLSPLLHEIGRGWARGTLGVAEEHVASQVIRELVGGMLREAIPFAASPSVILTTPAGQRHEFGALFAGLAACRAGWRGLYAGPDLPNEETARLAKEAGARAVAVSVLHPAADTDVAGCVRDLRGLLPPGVHLYVGGHREALEAADGVPGTTALPSFGAFERALTDS